MNRNEFNVQTLDLSMLYFYFFRACVGAASWVGARRAARKGGEVDCFIFCDRRELLPSYRSQAKHPSLCVSGGLQRNTD